MGGPAGAGTGQQQLLHVHSTPTRWAVEQGERDRAVATTHARPRPTSARHVPRRGVWRPHAEHDARLQSPTGETEPQLHDVVTVPFSGVAEPEADANAESGPKPEPEPESDPQPQPEPEPEPEPELDLDGQHAGASSRNALKLFCRRHRLNRLRRRVVLRVAVYPCCPATVEFVGRQQRTHKIDTTMYAANIPHHQEFRAAVSTLTLCSVLRLFDIIRLCPPGETPMPSLTSIQRLLS